VRQLACTDRIFYWIASEHEVKNKVKMNVRPRRPRSVPKSFYKLMEKCWQHEPERRISMNNVLAYFGINPSRVLDPGPLFMAQSRQSCLSCTPQYIRSTESYIRSSTQETVSRTIIPEIRLDRSDGLPFAESLVGPRF
jgi:hypothetical protein